MTSSTANGSISTVIPSNNAFGSLRALIKSLRSGTTSVTYSKAGWLLPVMLAAACGGPTEPQFTQTEANQIRQRTRDFETTFNTKDPAKVSAFYPGESVLLPTNAPAIRGREGIEKFYVELYAQGGTDLEMETKDVRGHGPLAYEAGTYSLNRKPPTGSALRDRGKYLFIWRQQNGVWSLEYTIWNSDLPELVPMSK